MLAFFSIFLNLALSAKECTYTSNLISITDDSSLADIKDDLRPIFLRLTSPGCPYSPSSSSQWEKSAELYPQVDFVTVDCWKNEKICSLFGTSITTPYHAFVPAGSTKYIDDSTFGNIEEISKSPQKFLDTIQKYSGLYPISSPILNLFPVVTDSFFQNVENPIFLLYNSRCSDEVPFLNAWTKIANEEIVPEDDYPRVGMLDCSKYFDECQRWIRPYAPQTPVALIYSRKSGNFEVLESYTNLNSDKIYSLYSNALTKPQKSMPTPIPVPDNQPAAPSDEGYTLIQNTELLDRTVNDIKSKYVEAYVHPSSACATPSECLSNTLNVPSQCPEIIPSDDDHTNSLKIINFLRGLAGLSSDVVEDPDWSAMCYSTAINMHKIGKVPSDHVIKEDHATPAYCGKAENIQTAKDSLLSENTNTAFASTYKLFIDEGAHNDLVVGHRRQLLHPGLKKIGIGFYPYKEDDFGSYKMMRPAVTVTKVLDNNFIQGQAGVIPSNLNFISWPPQGPFPIDQLPSNWHISHPDFSSTILKDLNIYVSRDDGAELKVKQAAVNYFAGMAGLVIQMTPEALQLCQPMRTITVSVYNIISKKLYRFSFELFNTDDLSEICLYSTDSSKCPSTVTQENKFGPGSYQAAIFSSATGNVKVHVADQVKLTQPLKITSNARFFICDDGEIEGEIEIGKQTIIDVKSPSKIDFTTTWSVSDRKIGKIETAYKAKSISISIIDPTEETFVHDLTFYTGVQASCKLSSTLFRGMTNDIYYTIGGSNNNYYVSVDLVAAYQAYTTVADEYAEGIELYSLFEMQYQRTNKRIIKIYTSSISKFEPINLSCFIPNSKKDYQFYMFGGEVYFSCDLNISKVANSILFDSNKIYGETYPYKFEIYKFDIDDSRDVCPMNYVTINNAIIASNAISMPYVKGDNTAKSEYDPSKNFNIFPEADASDSSTINAYRSSTQTPLKKKAIIITNGKHDTYTIRLNVFDDKYDPIIVRPAEGTESKQITIKYETADLPGFIIPDGPSTFRTYFENYQDLILDLPAVQKRSSSPSGFRSLIPAYRFDNCTKVRFTESGLNNGNPIEIDHSITLRNIKYGFTVLTSSVKVDSSDSYDASTIQTKELNVISKTTPTIKQMTIKERINVDSATLILENCTLENQIELNMQKNEVWPSISLFETEFEPKSISIDLGFKSSSKLLEDENEEYESHSLITGIKNAENKCESIKVLAQVTNKGKFEIECSSDKTELVAVKGKNNAPDLLPEDSVTPQPTPGTDDDSNILLCNEETCNIETDGHSSNYTIRVNVQQSKAPVITIRPTDGTKSTPISIIFVDVFGTQTTIPNNKVKFVAHFENYDDLTIENPVVYEGNNLLDCYNFKSCGKVTFTNQPQEDEPIQNDGDLLLDGSASEIDYGVPISYPSCRISNTGSYVARNIQTEKLFVDPSLTTTISEIKISKEIEVVSSKVTLQNCELITGIKVSISKSTNEWPLIALSNVQFSPSSINVDLHISNLNKLLEENERYIILSGLTSCDSIISKTTLVNGGEYQLVCSDDQTSLNVEKGEKPVEKPTDEKPVDKPTDEKPVEKPTDEKPVDKPTDEKPVEKPTDEKPVEKPTDEKPVEKPTDEKTTDEKPEDDQQDETQKHTGGLPVGAIIGIVVGVIVIIVIIIVIVVIKKRRGVYESSSANEDEIRNLENVEKETKAQDI